MTFVVSLVLFAPMVWLGGYVASTLWLWFAVPIGAPVITVMQAVGLRLLAKLFTMGPADWHHIKEPRPKSWDWIDQLTETAEGAVLVVGMLGMGWVFRQFL